MASGRHRNLTRAQRALSSPMGITAMVVACVLVVTIGVPAGIRWFASCGSTSYLRVAASLSIAPVIQRAADDFNSARHSYDGTCFLAQASEIGPHRVLAALSGGPGSTIAPDVWIPESSAWMELARISESGAQTIETQPRSLASSPVVLAAPQGAEGIPEAGEASWELILPGERSPERPLVMVDPNRGADGMAAMHAVRRLLGSGDGADTAMTDFVRDVQTDTAFGHIQLQGVYPSPYGEQPLTVVPEQSVFMYNSRGPDKTLNALYPSQGTVLLDYPFVATSDDPLAREAADDLYQVLRRPSFQEQLRGMGFRRPDGTAGEVLENSPGIVADVAKTHDSLTGDALLASVEDWNRLSMQTRALVLADVSGAAGQDLDDGRMTRLAAAVQAAQLGLSLFPDKTDLGLWLMSSEFDSGSGYKVAQELGRIGEPLDDPSVTRRERLQEVAGRIEVEGGEPRLYDTLWAAYTEMTAAYEEDKINSLIVLTAGGDDGSSDISHEELVAELENSFDPENPVTMFIIAFGDQGREERDKLEQLAEATSGTLFVTSDPDEIGDIFLSSISRRLCVPDCGN